jgi:hypothetical protein
LLAILPQNRAKNQNTLTQFHEKNPEKRSDWGFLEFQVMGIQDVTAVEGRKKWFVVPESDCAN